MNKGEKVHVSIRPESILQGEGENTLTGEITFVEFTGLSVNYIVKIPGITLKVMIINTGGKLLQIGDSIQLTYPVSKPLLSWGIGGLANEKTDNPLDAR